MPIDIYIKRRILHAEVLIGLAFARLLIKIVPFRLWRKTLGPVTNDDLHPATDFTERQVKRAKDVGQMIRRVAKRQNFDAICFPQAIAGRWILKRRGIPSQIVLGSRRENGDPANARASSTIALHAWLRVGDEVITGQSEHQTYTSFAGKKPVD